MHRWALAKLKTTNLSRFAKLTSTTILFFMPNFSRFLLQLEGLRTLPDGVIV